MQNLQSLFVNPLLVGSLHLCRVFFGGKSSFYKLKGLESCFQKCLGFFFYQEY